MRGMTSKLSIGTPRDIIAVKLVGIDYKVKVPKTITAMRVSKGLNKKGDQDAQLAALLQWVDAAFGKTGESVRARIEDDADDLDVGHITELMAALSEWEAERPTSLSSDS